MEITESLKGCALKAFIVFFSLCTLLWFSVISYALLYYLYIPAVAHIRPVHLQYDMSCFKGKQCHPMFPYDNITLIESGNEFLRGGQGYAIELVLELPESERNWMQGVFMIKLDMVDCEGSLIKSSRRTAMLRYRSALFKTIYTLFFMPGLLAGSFEEKQSLTIPLFEDYVENSYNSAHFAYVEIQAQTIEVYSSSLRIHAKFTGLRYLMYYWPVISAIIGIGGNFLFLVVTIGLIWFHESTKTSNDNTNLGFPQRQIQLRSRNKRTDDSLLVRQLEADVPRSGREDSENEPTYNETENRRILLVEAGEFRSQGTEIENISGHLEPEMEKDILQRERENRDFENVPRQRSLAMNLRDDDD